MVRATSVLLILLAVSTATFAAGNKTSDDCSCTSSDQVVVALGSSFDNLSVALLDRKLISTATFTWRPKVPERRWTYLVIHHSATESGSVDSIHNNHRRRKDAAGNSWLGIGYHFVIGNGSGMEDGNVEATFRWREQIHGAHSGSTVHNSNGIGICLIGNFQQDAPTQKQLMAVSNLIDQLSLRYKIPDALVIGHNSVKPTACPGKNFPLQDVIRKSVLEQKSAG